MTENDQPGRVLAWLAGILFTLAIVLLFIGQREELAWMQQTGWISCSLFLLMPAILLMLRPNLALALMNTLFNRAAHNQAAGQKTDWQRLSGEEKSYLILAAVVAAAVGIYILIQALLGKGVLYG